MEEIHARLATHIKVRMQQKELEKHSHQLEELVTRQAQEISRSQTAAIAGLAKLAESRDDDTGQHIERISLYCKALAESLAGSSAYQEDISEVFIEAMYLTSPLHDIGKIAIPDNILLKPDKLSDTEFDVMKKHTVIGAKNLAAILAKYPKNALIRAGLMIARSHHERWDGTGYPDGSSGKDIPLHARIMAVADAYEAMRSNKCYRKALPHDEVSTMILNEAGSHFDPQIVAAFEKIAGQFERISNEKADLNEEIGSTTQFI